MKLSHLLAGSASRLALAAAAIVASASLQPAAADSGNIFSGGSSLFSEAARTLYDCYRTTGCNLSTPQPNVIGQYASVGSGSARRAYITDDTHELLTGSGFALPAALPDASPAFLVSPIVSYPYTDTDHGYRLDAGYSDAPLEPTVAGLTVSAPAPGGAWTPAANWQTFVGTLTTPTVQTNSFNTATFGQPIQIPSAAVAVDIGVNIPYPNSGVWNVQLQTQTTELLTGKVIQAPIHLNPAQVCAIFTGKVTNWSDDTTLIPYLTYTPPVPPATTGTTAIDNQKFSWFNGSAAVPYATASTPIKLVYRSDKSGTTFIITNFLKSYCPVLGAGYSWLATATSLPTTDFNGVFKPLVIANGGNTANWIGATLNGGVADLIASTTGGIGYISNDFTKAYYATGPLPAAIGNEEQRYSQIYKGPFTIPTVASTTAAWNFLPPPAGVPYTNYDVYSVKRAYAPFGTVGYLPVPSNAAVGAYPITGTTFTFTYSCFASANRATVLVNYLKWLYNANTDVKTSLAKNGFAPVSIPWANSIKANYLTATASTAIKSLPGATNGCTGVAGGA